MRKAIRMAVTQMAEHVDRPRRLAVVTQLMGLGLMVVGAVLIYLMIAIWPTVTAATGTAAASGNSNKTTVATILSHPGGGWLTVIIGLVAIGVGLGQFLEAYRATFKEDLKNAAMTDSERKWAIRFGRFVMFARGVSFLVIGWFVVQAGIHHDAAQVQGFGGAFIFLLNQPFGRVLLGVIALGFVSLGLHSFACARWIRLMGSSG